MKQLVYFYFENIYWKGQLWILIKKHTDLKDIYSNADDSIRPSNFTPLCISPTMVVDPYSVLSSDSLDFIYLQSVLSTM